MKPDTPDNMEMDFIGPCLEKRILKTCKNNSICTGRDGSVHQLMSLQPSDRKVLGSSPTSAGFLTLACQLDRISLSLEENSSGQLL